MIEVLVRILEHFLALAREEHERSQSIFDHHVEPMFADLAVVHRDYLKMFDAVWERLWDGTDLMQIAAGLAEERQQLELFRKELIAGLRAYENARLRERVAALPPDVEQFLTVARSYFRLGTGREEIAPWENARHSTQSQSLLEIIHRAALQQEKSNLVRQVRRLRRDLDDRWMRLTEAYATCRASVAR